MIAADFVVIGAGIAGASVAYELSHHAKVVVLEREAQAGYHATGRSAALFSEIYGNAVIRALSRAGRAFLFDPPAGFTDGPLLAPRGVLYISAQEQRSRFDAFRGAPDVARDTRELNTAQALELVPILRQTSAAHCAHEPAAMDVEAASLHQGYLKGAKALGCRVLTNCEIVRIERTQGTWIVTTAAESVRAPVLVNAAGAWADELAHLAGVAPIGIEPLRRTACLVQPPAGFAVDRWPMVMDVDEQFYFKPDAGKLLVSPADETPSRPCDAQPEDLDVAIAVDRFEQATTASVSRVTHSWAGLRTFVADRTPVAGFEPAREGFFWLAGQGGYGIQTAPGLSRLAAALARGEGPPDDILVHGVSVEALSPARLRDGVD
jgi:D-arginine dehydrogenase